MHYERDHIRKMTPYVPGEQPEADDVVKLNTNENPYPPSEPVMRALHEFSAEALRRYPQPTASLFRQLAAEVHGVNAENILAVNGGDELLRLLITTFVEPGEPIGTLEPSYSLYPVLAQIHGSPVITARRQVETWATPADLPERMNQEGVKVLFIVNPNAPTGQLTSASELAQFAERFKGLLVVDEAYVDFVDPQSKYNAVPLIRQFKNVLLLRTMSKGYSLAGLRFGYAIAHTGLIEPMLKTKDSYNTDAVAQALALAALRHRELAATTWRDVREERRRLTHALRKLDLHVWSSQTNFLLVRVSSDQGGGAKNVYRSLKNRHIFVRYFDLDDLRDKLRITIGTPEQNDKLIAALKELI